MSTSFLLLPDFGAAELAGAVAGLSTTGATGVSAGRRLDSSATWLRSDSAAAAEFSRTGAASTCSGSGRSIRAAWSLGAAITASSLQRGIRARATVVRTARGPHGFAQLQISIDRTVRSRYHDIGSS